MLFYLLSEVKNAKKNNEAQKLNFTSSQKRLNTIRSSYITIWRDFPLETQTNLDHAADVTFGGHRSAHNVGGDLVRNAAKRMAVDLNQLIVRLQSAVLRATAG